MKMHLDVVPPPPYRRETKEYPSKVDNTKYDCTKPEKKEYTGTVVKGIATMHKSNAVPVINEQEAKDISKMRRN